MTQAYLEISKVSKTFNTGREHFLALREVDLTIDKGEFISLIGHSGCGKSTVLNIVAGLTGASSGGVIVDGREVTEPGPDRAVVFQNHALLPWLTAFENVELAVRQVARKRMNRQQMRDWTLFNLERVNMAQAASKRPDELSGGMKQRIGIARALAMEPKVLLLDEPFGALDALTRAQLQDTLMDIHAELGNTVIMITHDVDEAVLLSDRIVMMTNGPAATVGQVLDVPLPRPRERVTLADDAEFNRCRGAVLRFLYERQGRPQAAASPPGEAVEEAGEAGVDGAKPRLRAVR